MIRKKRIFYGWWIVLSAAIVNLIAGGTVHYGFTAFFNPIRNTFGWGAAVTSIAFSLRGLETGLLDPFAGFIVDRTGPRKLMLVGWSVVGLSFILMSRINSIWTFYGSSMLLAAGLTFGTSIVSGTAIANWFTRKRSRAISFMYAGTGASGLLVPVLALLIGQFGWRQTLIFVGVASWIICLPLRLLMRHKPSQYGYLPDGGEYNALIYDPANVPSPHSSSDIVESTPGSSAVEFSLKAALRTRAFWFIALTFFFQHISASAVMVHIVPYLESVKVPTVIAAIAVTGMTLSSLIGRLGFGFLGDFTDKRYLMAIAFVIQAIGVFMFSFIDADRIWLIVPFLLIYGTGFGGPIPVRPALQADYFGIRNFGAIFGFMALMGMLGGIFSPVIAGWVFDITGSYRLAWQLLALTTLPAIPLILLARAPRQAGTTTLH